MNIALIELLIVTGVVLGIGFWQLWDVNRELRKHDDDDKPGNDERESDGERPD